MQKICAVKDCDYNYIAPSWVRVCTGVRHLQVPESRRYTECRRGYTYAGREKIRVPNGTVQTFEFRFSPQKNLVTCPACLEKQKRKK